MPSFETNVAILQAPPGAINPPPYKLTEFIMRLDEYSLRISPNMVGLNEAWIIDETIYVSPAIFQLLTDEDDAQTRKFVSSQLSVRTATLKELNELQEKK